jgi:hypothetical protein
MILTGENYIGRRILTNQCRSLLLPLISGLLYVLTQTCSLYSDLHCTRIRWITVIYPFSCYSENQTTLLWSEIFSFYSYTRKELGHSFIKCLNPFHATYEISGPLGLSFFNLWDVQQKKLIPQSLSTLTIMLLNNCHIVAIHAVEQCF